MTALVTSMVFVPYASCSRAQRRALDRWVPAHTYSHKPINDEPRAVSGVIVVDDGVWLPRHAGLAWLQEVGLSYEIDCSEGNRLRDVTAIELRDYQHDPVDELVENFKAGALDQVMQAATGKGKTVMSLEVARRLGRSTLIVVDQDNLLQQWTDELKRKLRLSEHQIGVYQGETLRWQGYPFVVAMVQSLYRKDWPEGFAEAFGTVIYDEAHTTAAAECYGSTLTQLPCRYRLMVSATFDQRRDAFGKVLRDHVGDIRVLLQHQHRRSTLRVLYRRTRRVYPPIVDKSPYKTELIDAMVDDSPRNQMIVDAVLSLYGDGHDVLVLSHSIDHLEYLQAMLRLSGVASSEIGISAGELVTWRYAKNPRPRLVPAGSDPGVEYTPVALVRHRRTQKKAEDDAVKEHCRIILATFGRFRKGVDVPRLSAGLDATPEASGRQAHGRVLREKQGKRQPVWVTIRDEHCARAEGLLSVRIHDYLKSNVEVFLWRLDKGVRVVDAKALISDIRTNKRKLDASLVQQTASGIYTRLTPTSAPSGGRPR